MGVSPQPSRHGGPARHYALQDDWEASADKIITYGTELRADLNEVIRDVLRMKTPPDWLTPSVREKLGRFASGSLDGFRTVLRYLHHFLDDSIDIKPLFKIQYINGAAVLGVSGGALQIISAREGQEHLLISLPDSDGDVANRWAAVHLLGHYLLHAQPGTPGTFKAFSTDWRGEEAYWFALGFVLPTSVLEAGVEEYKSMNAREQRPPLKSQTDWLVKRFGVWPGLIRERLSA